MTTSDHDQDTTDALPQRRPQSAEGSLVRRLRRQLPPDQPEAIVDALISRDDYRDAIGQISPPALYNLIREAGWDQGIDLVAYATPYQLQVCLDLDCWRDDRLTVGRMNTWLAALVAEASDEDLARAVRELDPEIMAMFFMENLPVVALMEEGRIPDWLPGESVGTSPDNVYAISYPEDEDVGALMRALIDRLYHVDPVMARILLEASRWELPAPLEEEARRWRMSRLEEYGYLPREEAMAVYALLDPARTRDRIEAGAHPRPLKVAPPEHLDLPAVLEDELGDESTFWILAALARIEDDGQLQRHLHEILSLQNKTMIADGIEPGEPASGRQTIRRTLGYLSLGLEFLARGDMQRAVELLEQVPMRDIFRVGFSLGARLQAQARALERRPALTIVDGERFSLLHPDDEALFDALLRPRPTWAADAMTYDLLRRQEQLDAAALRISLVALKQLWVFGLQSFSVASLSELVYGAPPSAEDPAPAPAVGNEPIDVHFDLLFATWLANFLLDQQPSLEPLDAARLTRLADVLRQTPWGTAEELVPFFRPAIARLVEGLPPGLTGLVTRWLGATLAWLDEELGEVEVVDAARFFSTVVLIPPDAEGT